MWRIAYCCHPASVKESVGALTVSAVAGAKCVKTAGKRVDLTASADDGWLRMTTVDDEIAKGASRCLTRLQDPDHSSFSSTFACGCLDLVSRDSPQLRR